MKKLILFLLLALPAFAATPVTLAPIPQFYAADSGGNPLAFGCVFTYQSGSTTPLATFTDFSGVTQNPNPVILGASGSANIWIQAGAAYTFKVVSSGGTNCAAGSTKYTVNGIGGGSSQLTTNVTASATPQFTAIAQNQLFLFTLTSNTVALPLVVNNVQAPSFITFQIMQNSSGGWSFSWPTNMIGGASIRSPFSGTAPNEITTQTFIWNGTTATAIGPGVNADGPQIIAGNILADGQLYTSGNAFLGANLNITGLTTLVGGQKFGTSQTVTGFQGSAGTLLASASGSFVSGDTICSNGTSDLVDCGTVPYFVRFADATSYTVNANTIANQNLHVYTLPTAALNLLNRSFRVSGHVLMRPTGSANSGVKFGGGNSGSIASVMVLASQTGSTDAWDANFVITCIVSTPGAIGQFICSATTAAVTQGAGSPISIGPPGVFNVDTTGAISLSLIGNFGTGSASNSATQDVLTIEQLN